MTEAPTKLKNPPDRLIIPRSSEIPGIIKEVKDRIHLFKTVDRALYGTNRDFGTRAIADCMIQSDDSFGFNCRQLFGISKTQVMTISKLNAAGLQRLRQSIIFQNERNLVSVIDPELDQINSLALGQEDFDADHPPCFEFIRPYLDILFQLRAEKSILSSTTPIFDLQNKLLAKIFADKNLENTGRWDLSC